MDKGTIDWLTNEVCVLESEKFNGVKMVFRDSVLLVADTTVGRIVAEITGEPAPSELTQPSESVGPEYLQLTRSQWDFYFRRRLEERGLDAPIYTSNGLESRCPFCGFKSLSVKLPPTGAKLDGGLWNCRTCKMLLGPNRYSGNGVSFELLLTTKGQPRKWSTRRLVEARAKINAIARESIEQGYRSPDAPTNQNLPGSSVD